MVELQDAYTVCLPKCQPETSPALYRVCLNRCSVKLKEAEIYLKQFLVIQELEGEKAIAQQKKARSDYEEARKKWWPF